MLIERVADLIRDVAEKAIVPRFRSDGTTTFQQKELGEVVTEADVEAERLLALGLASLKPDVPVIGEESCDGAALRSLYSSPPHTFWLVDPLDGTSNFAAGSQVYATMVALVQLNEIILSWIYQPATTAMFVAEHGSGAFANGQRIVAPEATVDPSDIRGAILTRFLEVPVRQLLMEKAATLKEVLPGQRCSGFEYPMIATGDQHFAMFWRALPWDHAPGALLLSEAGGAVCRLDGAQYRPCEDRRGLLATTSPAAQQLLLSAIGDAFDDVGS
nr:inositol monophosphatase family protein [Nitrosomonas nitrosa]